VLETLRQFSLTNREFACAFATLLAACGYYAYRRFVSAERAERTSPPSGFHVLNVLSPTLHSGIRIRETLTARRLESHATAGA